MLAAVLLPACLAWAEPEIPAAARLEAGLSSSAQARRLLVADGDVPRRETHASGLPLAVDERGGESPEIVVDLERLGDLPPGEAAAEYARALARAAVAAPIPLVEAEQASRQWTVQVLVEAAVEDPALSSALRAAELKPAPARGSVLDRAARDLALFERSPDAFYADVESGGVLPREAVRLTALEDLFALRAVEIRALREAPDGPYGELSGRRYPGPVLRAAFLLRAPGALARLREALGAYDSVGVAPLRAALARRRRLLLSR
jgi:hypothetical protein